MAGLIDQIQRDALDRSISVSDLLRKVKFAAAKLKLNDLEKWVDHELKGYEINTDVPEYRQPKGVPFGEDTDGRHRPLTITGEGERWSTVVLGEPIAALEHSIAGNSDSFYRPYPAGILEALNKHNRNEIAQAGVRFSSAAMVKIVDTVRTLILEWAIGMEKAGITGEGLSFTDEERRIAAASNNVINIGSIGSMVGVLGVGNTSGDIIASPISIERVRSLALQFGTHAHALVSEGVDSTELERLREKLDQELSKSIPDQSLIALTLKEISEKLKVAASGVVAQGVISIINSIFGLPAA